MVSAFFESLMQVGSPENIFTILDVCIVLALSFILNLIVAKVYQCTHKSVSYSVGFVQTVVIMGTVVSAIMLIIGSNIARAFTLVGALSIVRFRNAIKETRDVRFIFFAMAVGMACGTRFYTMAIIMTIAICFMVYIMFTTNFGSKKISEELLKIQITNDVNYEKILAPLFEKYLKFQDMQNNLLLK